MKSHELFKMASLAIITLLYLLLGSSIASAQKIELGVRFMPTFSKFDINTPGDGKVTGKLTAGLGFGVKAGYNFSDYVGVQIEGIYNTFSQKYTDNSNDRKVNLKYINVPLLLSLNTGRLRKVNFNVVGGPQVGFNIGSDLTGSNSDSTTTILQVKKGDVGLAYGAGFDFGLNPSNTIRLSVGFRGVFGLLDISDNNRTNTTNTYYLLDRSKIQTYSGVLGITFLL